MNRDMIAQLFALFLAKRTVKARTLSLPDLRDMRSALPAGLARPPIYPVLLLEIARLAVAIDEITQAASPGLDCKIERFLYCFREFPVPVQTDLAGRGKRIDMRVEQSLASVNIAHSRDDPAIHQHLLDAGAAASRFFIEHQAVEFGIQGLRTKLGQQFMMQDFVV